MVFEPPGPKPAGPSPSPEQTLAVEEFRPAGPLAEAGSIEETLSDVDDSEIDQFFLSQEEAAMKSIIWHNMHKNWVLEQAEKKDSSVEKRSVKKRKKKEEESKCLF